MWPLLAYSEMFPLDFTTTAADLGVEVGVYMIRTRGVPLTTDYFRRAFHWMTPAIRQLAYRNFREFNKRTSPRWRRDPLPAIKHQVPPPLPPGLVITARDLELYFLK